MKAAFDNGILGFKLLLLGSGLYCFLFPGSQLVFAFRLWFILPLVSRKPVPLEETESLYLNEQQHHKNSSTEVLSLSLSFSLSLWCPFFFSVVGFGYGFKIVIFFIITVAVSVVIVVLCVAYWHLD